MNKKKYKSKWDRENRIHNRNYKRKYRERKRCEARQEMLRRAFLNE